MFKLIFFFLSFVSFSINAQELITDRPDQTESASTVSPNSLQIETGFIYENSDPDGLTTENFSVAGSLFRLGVVNNLELRLGFNYIITNNVTARNGFSDFLAGIKLNFLNEVDDPLDFGLILQTILPVGDKQLNPEQTEPELISAFSKQLNGLVSVGVNLGIFSDSNEEQIGYLYTTALGFSVSGKFSLFIEYYGNFQRLLRPDHKFDTGVTYLLSSDIQLDLSAGKSISALESYWFINSGISLRIKYLWQY
ncbi:MAG: hypothetical protein Kow0098_00850 [Ignavibacteriaceae bacterium]